MNKLNLISIISALLMVLWIYAAVSKLLDYETFQSQLARQPLPAWSMGILAWVLPMIELLTAAALYFQRTRPLGIILSFILMTCFTLYVGFGLAHIYRKVPCSCGGILNGASWSVHLVFNIFFTILSFTGWYLVKNKDLNIRKQRVATL